MRHYSSLKEKAQPMDFKISRFQDFKYLYLIGREGVVTHGFQDFKISRFQVFIPHWKRRRNPWISRTWLLFHGENGIGSYGIRVRVRVRVRVRAGVRVRVRVRVMVMVRVRVRVRVRVLGC